jgi:hypothetical protein
MATLKASTLGITSNSPNDSTYNMVEGVIESWNAQRDSIAKQIKSQLEGAEFGGLPINEGDAAPLIRRAQRLLAEARKCSVTHSEPAYHSKTGARDLADARFQSDPETG